MRQTLRLNAKKSSGATRIGSAEEHKALGQIARRWIRCLELDQPVWRSITIFYAEPDEIPGCVGYCSFTPEHQSAEILILHPDYLQDHTKETGQTVEHIVVHELLHLVLDGHKSTGKSDSRHEQAINCLARALLKSR